MERKLSHPFEISPSRIYLIGKCVLLLYLQVHTRQWACDNQPFPKGGHNGAGRISCNCGAVLRDHNDVIEFNCCNQLMVRDRRTPITVKIRSKKCLSPGISIKKVIPGVNGKYEVSIWFLKVHYYRKKHKHVLKEMLWKYLCHLLPIITIRKRKITELVDSLCTSAENIMFFQVWIINLRAKCDLFKRW